MNTIFKCLTAIVCLTFFIAGANAQQVASSTTKLNLGKLEPYEMQVTYNKTSHLIFPSAIRYVDLGSEYLIAGKAEDAENVLRIKASVRDFEEETNFSVITDDGRFYNFNVFYNPYPLVLNYDLLTMQKASDRENGNDVLFEELGGNSPSLAGLLMETIYKRNKRNIHHIESKSDGIEFLLKGIYVHDGKFYVHTELQNNSHVPFDIDFVKFKVVDRKVAKRTVIQEKEIMPVRHYYPKEKIKDLSTQQQIFLLNKFTFGRDKILKIEISEKNGTRGQVLKVKNKDLIHASMVFENR